MNELDYDVVICGAGPSGATASLFLSQSGIRHLIIDQSVFPRPKVCGDSITPLCFTILQQVIPDIHNHFAEKLQVRKINKIRVYSFNQRFADLNLSDFVAKEKNLFYTVSRYVLDEFLVQQVRQRPEAILWENSKFEDYNVTAEGVTMQIVKDGHPIQISTKMIIAADGARSVFRKNIFRRPIDRKQMAAVIRTYYKDVKPSGKCNMFELYIFENVMPGYFWIFPMADGTYNVGLGITSDVIQSKRINLRKLMDELIIHHPLLKDRFENATRVHPIGGAELPFLTESEPKLSDTRILLAGDAGSLADPVSGEGIGPGIVSGKYAALTAVQALKANDFSASFLQKYDVTIHDKITRAYAIRISLFDWFTKYPWRINTLIRVYPKIRWIRNLLANLIFTRFRFSDIKSLMIFKKLFKNNV